MANLKKFSKPQISQSCSNFEESTNQSDIFQKLLNLINHSTLHNCFQIFHSTKLFSSTFTTKKFLNRGGVLSSFHSPNTCLPIMKSFPLSCLPNPTRGCNCLAQRVLECWPHPLAKRLKIVQNRNLSKITKNAAKWQKRKNSEIRTTPQ